MPTTQYGDLMHEQHSKNTCSRELEEDEAVESSAMGDFKVFKR